MIEAMQITGELFLFLLTILFYFYIPGNYLLSFSKIEIFYPGKIFLSIISGSIAFTLVMYILSWLNLQWVVFPIMVFVAFLFYKNRLFSFSSIPSIHKKPIVLVSLLSFLFSLPMI